MKRPAGPKTPKLIQTLQAIWYPMEYLEDCARVYGDTFTAKFTSFPESVIFSHPQALQEIFTADSKSFESGVANRLLKPSLGENSMILLDGDRHTRQRRLLTPPFHGERMRAYGQIICDVTMRIMGTRAVDQIILTRAAMQEISLRVILRAVFGLDEGERFEQLRSLLSAMSDSFNSPLRSSLLFLRQLQQDWGPWSPWGQFLRRRQEIDHLIYAEIRDRRASDKALGEDILSLMMSAQDEAGQPMTDVELRDELMTLLIAGHETTASALTWALYWIHRQPQVREKLLQELEELGPEPDFNAIARLPYLHAVYQETLRLYPVVLFSFFRVTQTPFTVMGEEYAPGTYLSPCIYLTHHRPDLYPEPKQFRPERFLERQYSPYEFLPFGGGNRRCIGMAFAQYEIKLVLATVLSRFQFTLVEDRPIRSVRRGLTFSPEGDVPVRVVKRPQMAQVPVTV